LESASEERFNIEQNLKTKLNEVEELKSESEKQNLLLLESNKVNFGFKSGKMFMSTNLLDTAVCQFFFEET
jgi:hypothetical protein